MKALVNAPQEAHHRALDSKLASSRRHFPELVRLGASPCKILTEVPGRQLAPQHLLKNDLFEALRRASGWPRRDLTAASVFVVFGELDFVEFLCLSQANRLELGKERKSARSGAEALPSAALCLVHAHSCCKYLRPRRGALQRHVEYSPHRSCLPYSRDKCIPILKWCCRGHLVAQGLLEHGTITLTDLPDHIGGAP